MTSSRTSGPRQVPPPPNSRAGTAYTRFIPREELQGFASWTPGALADTAATPAPGPQGRFGPGQGGGLHRGHQAQAAPDPSPEEGRAAVHQARQAGYQDGYRDGLVALESFKHSHAQQLGAQFAAVLQAFDAQLGALEQGMASAVAKVATLLARQVVRHELVVQPELVARVAQEAVHAVLLSARHIVVQVHPADQVLIAAEAADALAARGARLVPNASLARGDCVVESDAGSIDARIATRWHDCVQALGTGVAWGGAEDDADLAGGEQSDNGDSKGGGNDSHVAARGSAAHD